MEDNVGLDVGKELFPCPMKAQGVKRNQVRNPTSRPDKGTQASEAQFSQDGLALVVANQPIQMLQQAETMTRVGVRRKERGDF